MMRLLRRAAVLARRKYYKACGHAVIRTRYGRRLILNPRSRLDLRILTTLDHERAQMDTVAALIEKHGIDTVLDIGANSGIYSVYCAGLPRIKSVHSFEPVPRTYHQLCGNIFINGQDDIVTPHNVALGSIEAMASINISNRSSGTARFGDLADETERSISVPVKVLDTYLPLSGQRLFIKIDVEGYEHEVLKGMTRTLQENFACLQMELWESKDQTASQAIFDLLSQAGYTLATKIHDDHYFVKTQG